MSGPLFLLYLNTIRLEPPDGYTAKQISCYDEPMITQLVISGITGLIGWFVLMYLSTNLLGLFVRGLFTDPEIDRLGQEGSDFVKQEVRKNKRADIWMNITALALIVGFFYLLFHFLNIYALLAAVMLMAGRLPDLIWEIKHGKKINTSTMPKNLTYWLTSLLDWASLPMLWYGVYLLVS